MIRGARRGAVEIHYDDSLAAFHCPHCGMEFAPDDVLCISCGYEFADEQHPYAVSLRRPTPVLDAAGFLTDDSAAALTTALQALSQQCGMEVLLAIFPPELQRPPSEIAWYYGNTWEVGGITSDIGPIRLPPAEPAKLMLAALGEILLLPWTLLKSVVQLALHALKPPPSPTERGLLIAVFPHWKTITLEPTIAADSTWKLGDPELAALLEATVADLTPESLQHLVASLGTYCDPPA
ncbi:MAG: hypothetical protein GEEBNDBF_02336 [bacterium]|nr:hypothetical protein [bacterium]